VDFTSFLPLESRLTFFVGTAVLWSSRFSSFLKKFFDHTVLFFSF